MSEDKPSGLAGAVAEMVKAAPIYQDTFQPAMQELGKGFGGVMARWTAGWQMQGVEARKNIELFGEELVEKIESIPEEQQIVPPISLVFPVVNAISYLGQETELREMFSNLLASASNREQAKDVHPSFVEIIKEITPVEAGILKILQSEQKIPAFIIRKVYNNRGGTNLFQHVLEISDFNANLGSHSVGIDNLIRLRLIDVDYSMMFHDTKLYDTLLEKIRKIFPNIELIIDKQTPYIDEESKIFYQRGIVAKTILGNKFSNICIPR